MLSSPCRRHRKLSTGRFPGLGRELRIAPPSEDAAIVYELIRPLLFRLEPERSHRLALEALEAAWRAGLLRLAGPAPRLPVRLWDLTFPNPVGLAAGMDKDGEHLEAWGALGLGFVEVGTVTPRPQPGNPPPRLFRIPEARALINRMGFNNQGVDRLVERLRRVRFPGVVGVNLGKNRDTPLERALEDYRYGLERVYPHCGYVVINVSSPNTPGLRELQGPEALGRLLAGLGEARRRLEDRHGRRVPLLVKLAPDLEEAELEVLARVLLEHGVDGAIATNTTLRREGVEGLPGAGEPGGLSGAPLRPLADAVLARLHRALEGRLPLVGVGGILEGRDAVEKVRAGASLVQLCTGLVYRGPGLVRACVRALAEAGWPRRAWEGAKMGGEETEGGAQAMRGRGGGGAGHG